MPIVITPSSGCGLLTAYTAGPGVPAWSGPPPTCGAGAFTLGFNQGSTAPPTTPPVTGVETAGSALLSAWLATGVPQGARVGYRITAPPGITIDNVVYDDSQLQNIANGRGWIGLIYWNGGTSQVHPNGTAFDAAVSGPASPTNYWGIELRCIQSACTWPAKIQLNSLTVYATEAQGPSITPVADPASVWNQTGHWIWNQPNDPWPLSVATADPSGVCTLSFQAGASTPVADPSLPAQTNSSWQECAQPASWTAAVDTNTPGYVDAAGHMPLSLQANNAAELPNAPTTETLSVDDEPVSVSLSTPNDPNPTVWVNHAVTVDATAKTGLSGLGAMSCGGNGAAAGSYPAGGLVVGGDGVKTVSCTAWNNAVDPQGTHNSDTSSVTVHIDEAPPAMSLEPVNPNDPTALVADTSDAESGVAGGSLEMAPAGTSNWTDLPTTFTGTQLVAHVDDAGLRGPYAFQVRSCDNVGNCASTTRTLTLPARAQAISEVSVSQLPATRCPGAAVKHGARRLPAAGRSHRTSRAGQAVEAGLRFAPAAGIVAHGASPVAVPVADGRTVGGSPQTLATSLSNLGRPLLVARATTQRHGALRRSCTGSTSRLANHANVAFGHPVRVHGLLMSSAGLPLAGQPIAVMTAPDNGSDAFAEAASVTTGPDGRWTATLPPGPSRIIEASYGGSPTVLPATGSATVITPAKIELIRVTPNRTPWGSTVRITGRVLGGYIPTSSKLLRLDLGVVGIPGLSKIQGIPNVSADGRFTTTYTFGHASGIVRFWLMVSSLPEAAFPFAPAHSRRVVVTVGVPAPASSQPRRHPSRPHHHKHKHRARAHDRHKRR
ncbi:MAG: hypothetical protein ACTHMY_08665 [Solirubrobacteraceae bacterium]